MKMTCYQKGGYKLCIRIEEFCQFIANILTCSNLKKILTRSGIIALNSIIDGIGDASITYELYLSIVDEDDHLESAWGWSSVVAPMGIRLGINTLKELKLINKSQYIYHLLLNALNVPAGSITLLQGILPKEKATNISASVLVGLVLSTLSISSSYTKYQQKLSNKTQLTNFQSFINIISNAVTGATSIPYFLTILNDLSVINTVPTLGYALAAGAGGLINIAAPIAGYFLTSRSSYALTRSRLHPKYKSAVNITGKIINIFFWGLLLACFTFALFEDAYTSIKNNQNTPLAYTIVFGIFSLAISLFRFGMMEIKNYYSSVQNSASLPLLTAQTLHVQQDAILAALSEEDDGSPNLEEHLLLQGEEEEDYGSINDRSQLFQGPGNVEIRLD